MASRLTLRQVSKVCPFCSARILNSFASICANPLRVLFKPLPLSQRYKDDRLVRRRRFHSAGFTRFVDYKGGSEDKIPLDEAQEDVPDGNTMGVIEELVQPTEKVQQSPAEKVETASEGATEWPLQSSLVEDYNEVTEMNMEGRVTPDGHSMGVIVELVQPTDEVQSPAERVETALEGATERPLQNALVESFNGVIEMNMEGRVIPVEHAEGSASASTATEDITMAPYKLPWLKQQDPGNSSYPTEEPPSIKVVEEIEEKLEEAVAEEGTVKDGEGLPWYLQKTYSRPQSELLPERSPLPELPENPPPVLEGLIESLDADLGINNIRIMDLRQVEPTPALGSDIIMIFGTARSERHLHISADKVCRWLRSNHLMSPFADGLIGRKELKLINKRRMRRGKVAASQVGEVDEAARTEWVCINVNAQGLVIQLFTKQRRELMQLEALWERKLDTSRKNREKAEKFIAEQGNPLAPGSLEMMRARLELESEEESINDLDKIQPIKSDQVLLSEEEYLGDFDTAQQKESSLDKFVDKVKEKESDPILQGGLHRNTVMQTPQLQPPQSRSIHTPSSGSLRVMHATTTRRIEFDEQPEDWKYKTPTTFAGIFPYLPPRTAEAIATGDYTALLNGKKPYTGPGDANIMQPAIALFAHVKHLRNTKSGDLLGKSVYDTNSTPFIRSFFQTMPTTPIEIHYHAWLHFLIEANSINHKAYPSSYFLTLFHQMISSGVDVPAQFYIDALEAFAVTLEHRNTVPGKPGQVIHETSRRMFPMTKTLQLMAQGSGYDINKPKVYNALFRGLFNKDLEKYRDQAKAVAATPGAFQYTGIVEAPDMEYKVDRRVFVLEEAMQGYDVQQPIAGAYENQLSALAMTRYWPAFWNRWKDIWYQGLFRDVELYKLCLGLVALSQTQREAVQALRLLPHSMLKEEPPVLLDKELARAFLAVIKVAQSGSYYEGEYSNLTRECQALLPGEAV